MIDSRNLIADAALADLIAHIAYSHIDDDGGASDVARTAGIVLTDVIARIGDRVAERVVDYYGSDDAVSAFDDVAAMGEYAMCALTDRVALRVAASIADTASDEIDAVRARAADVATVVAIDPYPGGNRTDNVDAFAVVVVDVFGRKAAVIRSDWTVDGAPTYYDADRAIDAVRTAIADGAIDAPIDLREGAAFGFVAPADGDYRVTRCDASDVVADGPNPLAVRAMTY